MNTKLTGFVLILMLMGIGGVGGFLYGQGHPVQPPTTHQNIVSSMIINDDKWDIYLIPKCVDASPELVYGEHSIISLDAFETGRIYPQSTWIWQRYRDTEVAMTIWGPGEDGITYSIELSKLAGNPFTVKIGGEVVLIMKSNPDLIDTGYEGYYVLTVELD